MFVVNEVKLGFFNLPSADDLFCDLTPKSLAALDKIKQIKRFRKDACLFSKGDPPRGIYRLCAGRAQLLLDDGAKDEHLARLIEPNEIFGLIEVFSNLPYEAEAKTITPCLCEFIEREDFILFLMNEPENCFRLARLLALRFQQSYRLFSLIN